MRDSFVKIVYAKVQSNGQIDFVLLKLYDESVSQAIQLGAKGYLFKYAEPDELILAIRSVYEGQLRSSRFVCPFLVR
jgi:DNA-binding NarL/FixJ family response regulator